MKMVRSLAGLLLFFIGMVLCCRQCYADDDVYLVDLDANSKGTIESKYVGNKAYFRGSGELEGVSCKHGDSNGRLIDITEIYIEEGITSIKDEVFSNMTIKKIQLPQSLLSIGERAFLDAKVEGEIIVPKNVKKIGQNAFCSNNIKKITFEDGIKTIGGVDGSGIQSVDIPGSVEIIPDKAFVMCNKLERVTLHEGLKVIGESAFNECTKLKSINLPDSLIAIKGAAFSFCAFKEITIPGSIKVLDQGLFDCCGSLKTLTIKEGVTEIKNNLCYGCENLDTLVLPSSLTKIGKDAFLECPNLSYIYVPGGVKTIADYSMGFLDPNAGTQSVADSSTKAVFTINATGRIKKKDFVICGKPKTAAERYAKKFKFTFINEKYYKKKFKSGHLKYVVTGQREVRCYGADRKLKSLRIPAKVYYKKRAYRVTGISAGSFMKNRILTSVILGPNVKYIGGKAFYKCSKMKRLTIKTKGLKASTVGRAALKGTPRSLIVVVPKRMKALYPNILRKKGLNKKAKFIWK